MLSLNKQLLEDMTAKLPPGKTGLSAIIETISFATDENFPLKKHALHGDIFKTSLFTQPTIFVRGKEACRFVLAGEGTYFVNDLLPSTRKLLGQKTVSVQVREEHRQRRQVLAPAFTPKSVSLKIDKLAEIINTYINRWEKIETLTWYPELRRCAFDLATTSLLEVDEEHSSDLERNFEIWSQGLFSVPLALPWSPFGRALKARKQLLKSLGELIEKQKSLPPEKQGILKYLLAAQDTEGQPLSFEELKDQLLNLLFAGHETIASALVSFCLLLAQHPKVFEKCRAEQEKVGTDLDFKKMSYLEKVWQEVLRRIPPVGGGFRKIIQDCYFQDYYFPKGWNLIYEISLTHLDPKEFEQPEVFEPDRFESPALTSSRGAYLPFGGGMRECLGKELAKAFLMTFGALIVRSHQWDLISPQNLSLEMVPVPKPKSKLQVVFYRS